MKIYIALCAHVDGVGAEHIHCALLAKLQPCLPIGMCDVKEVARVVHGDLMTLGGSQSKQGIFTV